MSTSTEERLRAALHARAVLVAPSDLRPLELPGERHRPRRRLVVALTGAAAAAVVAVLALQGGPSDRTPPRPADSASPAPSPRGDRSMDVDGDGGPDRVRLDYDAGTRRFTVRVDRAGGGTLEAGGVAAVAPELLTGFDLDGDTAAEVAVRVGVDTGGLPYVFTYVPDEGLVPVTFPEGRDGGAWSPGVDGAHWATRDGRLFSWGAPAGGAADGVVDFWSWRLEGRSAVPVGPQRRCLPDGADFPVPCGSVPSAVVEEGAADVDGDGADDRVEVRYTAARNDDSIDGFEVAVRTAAGASYTAQGPGGWRPELRAPLSLTGDGAQQVLVRQEGGDSDTPLVFALVGGTLQRAEPVATAPAPVSSWDQQGRTLHYWVAGDRLYSYRTVALGDPSPVPVEVWSWSLGSDGSTAQLLPTVLGRQCLPAAEELPRPC